MHVAHIILFIMLIYFGLLYGISYLTSRKSSDNEAFFLGNRKSPWWVVSIAMIGSSISGVTFVSVPGMVGSDGMSYMQMVIGFFFGYLVVAYVLLPLYYKLKLTSIYEYLKKRFGIVTYKTGASFFILSKLLGAAVRLYLTAMILQILVFAHYKIPFPVTVIALILLIWLYTHKSGIRTIIWTDTLQTTSFILALIFIIWQVASRLNMHIGDIPLAIEHSKHTRIFVFDDWGSKNNFFKQFFSGIFIVIVMTGLDQDMMQKNLSCRNLKDAQKNMLSYGFAFIPINLLFLSLGVLLLLFASQQGINLAAIANQGDKILPMLASQYLGVPVLILFTIGIIAAAFSSADSAITALTTSVCVDLLAVNTEKAEEAKQVRLKVHIGVSLAFAISILGIHAFGGGSVLKLIYNIASYTYGPLLGLFAFGLFTKMPIKDRLTPYICLASPVVCFGLSYLLNDLYNYQVGYELLMINGILTFIGLWAIRSFDSDSHDLY